MDLKRRKRKDDEETSYWLSYSDMMAALLLVFVLIITFTMLKSQEHVENLEKQKEELSLQQEQVELLKAQNEEKESELEELLKQNEEKESELSEQQELVESQQAQLAEQQELLDSQQEKLDSQQEKLDKLVGVRTEIIEALVREFAETDLKVAIDEKTGAITFDESILFSFGNAELKETGKEFLDEFFPRYVYILQLDQFRDYIAEIIIEGHTDSVGSYLTNLSLSQNRALAVARYCLADDGKMLDEWEVDTLRPIVTANGRSYSNLIYNEDGTENADASRRVEFKFRLTEEEMINEMKEILASGE